MASRSVNPLDESINPALVGVCIFVNGQVDATGKGVTDEDDIVIEVKEVEQEDAATSGGAQQKDAVGGKEIPQAEAVREVPPTAEEIASA